MGMLEYLFGESTYLGLLLFLLTFVFIVLCTESFAVWFWEKYGDRISNVFRQSGP